MRVAYLFILVIFIGVSCKKKPTPDPTISKYKNGILFLNEGLFQQNNATISFYSYTDLNTYSSSFSAVNNRGLGDTANDFTTYSIDGKDYIIIAVDVSSQVEIIDRFSLETVAQIPLFNGENGRSPRRVIVDEKKGYVCNFDGTVAVIDLINYSVEKLIEVGQNPDGMLIVNDHLYVSNSGGLNFPVYDKTVSVIDLSTNQVIETIETRINSSQMVVDNEGDIYLLSRGNYDDVESAIVRISTVTNTVEEVYETPMSSMLVVEEWLYFYNSEEKGIFRYNTSLEEFDTVKQIDLSELNTFYGLYSDAVEEAFYVVDANGYVNSSTIYMYKSDGTFLREIGAKGINTNSLIFN